MDDPRIDPIKVFIAAAAISSVGSLAAILRSNKPLTWRSVTAAMLYSGIVGMLIAMAGYNYFGVENLYFLLSVSGLAGIGGTTVLDFVVQAIRYGGINVIISQPGPPAEERAEERTEKRRRQRRHDNCDGR